MTDIFVNAPASFVHVRTDLTQLSDVVEKLLWDTTDIHTGS